MGEQISNLRVFCAYASKDKEFYLRLKNVLNVYCRQGLISLWDHEKILAGSEWNSEIQQQLHTADIILLLISPDFMSSDYSWHNELRWAIIRHKVGEACVIPVILRPTPGWESTPLGDLQVLPTGTRPITDWPKRDKAFYDVALGIGKVIDQIQQKERYPIEEYVIELRPFVHDSWPGKTIAEEGAAQLAEHWLDLISQEGSIRPVARHNQKSEWTFINHQGDCHIMTQWQIPESIDQFKRPFRSSGIVLTCKNLTLLDRLLEVGGLPYYSFQWTLSDDLDIPALIQRIYDKTGKEPTHGYDQAEKAYHAEYELDNESERFAEGQALRIRFSSKGTVWPAQVCLIHDKFPLIGFYRAHEIFSVQKLLMALQGDIPHSQFWQLIDEACLMRPKKRLF